MDVPVPHRGSSKRDDRVVEPQHARGTTAAARGGGGRVICGECVRVCSDAFRRVATRYAFRPFEIEDFLQDTWLAVLRSLDGGKFDPGRGQLADWLHVVARNRAVTYFRRRWREQHGMIETPLDLLPCRQSEDPALAVTRASDIEWVRDALSVLQRRVSPLCFAVFYLRRMEQRSVRDTAERYGLTSEQVRSYDHRARQRLLSIMRSDGMAT